MNTLSKFSSFVMDLYDLYSGITVEASTDHITIKIDANQEILLWFNDDKIFPEIVHNFEGRNAIDLDTVLEILNIVKKYEEMDEEK